MYSDGATDKGKRQPLLLGEREIAYLQTEAKRLIEDADAAEKNTERWRNEGKANLHARRAQCPLPGGLDALWSGRMVTADPSANIDTAVHVAHSWTVHSEEIDYDYWSVVDDRHAENGGQGAADHINALDDYYESVTFLEGGRRSIPLDLSSRSISTPRLNSAQRVEVRVQKEKDAEILTLQEKVTALEETIAAKARRKAKHERRMARGRRSD